MYTPICLLHHSQQYLVREEYMYCIKRLLTYLGVDVIIHLFHELDNHFANLG